MADDVHGELSRTITSLVLVEPFWTHLLMGLERLACEDCVGIALVSAGGRPQLRVQPKYFLEEISSSRMRGAALLHELLHLVLHHPTRMCRLAEPAIGGLAADLVVNQLIGPHWRLPPKSITLASFPELDLKANQSLETYYALLCGLWNDLKRLARSCSCSCCKGGTGLTGDQQSSLAAELLALPPEQARLSEAAKALCRALAQGARPGDHATWTKASRIRDARGAVSGETTPERELERFELETDRLLLVCAERTPSALWGRLPGAIRDALEDAARRRRPELDWRRLLRRFGSHSTQTVLSTTQRRPSRRYGTFPGHRVRRRQRLALALDVSGSVALEDIEQFFDEIDGIWRRGAEITVIECDARVVTQYRYRGHRPTHVGGRGGTAFDPVFACLRQRPDAFDGVIYFTDAFGPAPKVHPPCPLLWVVTRRGNPGPHLLFGRRIQLRS